DYATYLYLHSLGVSGMDVREVDSAVIHPPREWTDFAKWASDACPLATPQSPVEIRTHFRAQEKKLALGACLAAMQGRVLTSITKTSSRFHEEGIRILKFCWHQMRDFD